METDVVSAGGLTFDAQAIGNISHFRYIDAPRYPYASFAAKRADGLIGFSPRGGSAFTPESPSWFFNLANHGLLSEKRFGVISGKSTGHERLASTRVIFEHHLTQRCRDQRQRPFYHWHA